MHYFSAPHLVIMFIVIFTSHLMHRLIVKTRYLHLFAEDVDAAIKL